MKSIRLFLCWSKRKLLTIITEYKKAFYIILAYCIAAAFLLMNVDAVSSLTMGENVVQAKTLAADEQLKDAVSAGKDDKTNEKEKKETKDNHMVTTLMDNPMCQAAAELQQAVEKADEESADNAENKQEEYERKTLDERQDAETDRLNQIKVDEERKRKEQERQEALDRYKMSLCTSERKVLERIVQAEAGNQDLKGRMLVANVVVNRIRSSRFPNTVKGIVFQHAGGSYQFSPIQNGAFYRVKVSKKTKEAVRRVLKGENYSSGALFFVARRVAARGSLGWFDRSLRRLFTHGGHTFYR